MATNIKASTIAASYDRLVLVQDGNDIGAGTDTMNIEIQTQAGVATATPLYISTNRVGIGTATPASELHVHDASGGASTNIRITNDTTGVAADAGTIFYIDTNEGASLWNYENTEMYFGTNNNRRMTILATGYVGIGTASPTVGLEVMDTTTSSASTGGTLYLSSNDGAAMGSGHRLGGLAFVGAEDGSNTQREGAVIDALTSDAWSGTENGTILRFWTNDADNSLTQKMCILEGGEVGIGIAAPTKELHIVGTTLIDCGDDEGDYGLHIKKGATSSSFMIKLENEDASGTTAPWMELNHLDNGNFHIGKAYNDTYFTIEDTGNVGIGTTSPLTQLHIEQGGTTDDGQDGLTLGPVRSGHTSSNSMPLFLQSGWSAGSDTINRWNTWAIRGYQNGDDSGSSLYFSYQEDDTAQQPDWDDTSPIMVLGEDGDVGIGIAVPTYTLDVVGSPSSNYVARFHSDGAATTDYGVLLQAGADSPGTDGDCRWLGFADGDGTVEAVLQYVHSGTTGAIVGVSDERLKENIKDTSIDGLSAINSLNFREFNWTTNSNRGSTKVPIGLVAQEVTMAGDKCGIVTDFADERELKDGSKITDVQGVGYDGILLYLAKAVQELSAKVTALENA